MYLCAAQFYLRATIEFSNPLIVSFMKKLLLSLAAVAMTAMPMLAESVTITFKKALTTIRLPIRHPLLSPQFSKAAKVPTFWMLSHRQTAYRPACMA